MDSLLEEMAKAETSKKGGTQSPNPTVVLGTLHRQSIKDGNKKGLNHHIHFCSINKYQYFCARILRIMRNDLSEKGF